MSKSATRSTPNNKTPVNRADAAFLKLRVQELESEVTELKKRLTGLRKAKNTTLLKKEKEYVSTGAADLKRTHSGDKKVDELQKKLKELNLKHEKEIETLTRKKQQEEEDAKKLAASAVKNNPQCNHEEIIAELTKQKTNLEKENKDLQLFNDEFQRENRELRDKFEELFSELSVKEAQWCEREEQLNLKVTLKSLTLEAMEIVELLQNIYDSAKLKLQWGEKYKEWMEATEKKIDELQQANTLLRSYLKKPPGD